MTRKLSRNGNRGSRARTAALAWGLAMVPAMIATPPAAAQTFKLLYAFTGGEDGGGPWGTPLLTGNILYATTFYGGSASAGEAGAVFEFLPATLTGAPFYDFTGQPNGAAPMSGLITDGFGDFFGTTTKGGFLLNGTIYEISDGAEIVINSFNGTDGKTPEGSIFMDAAGDLYGTTSQGGANDAGTVWAFSAFGGFVPLYSFGATQTDGVNPASGVVLVLSPNTGVSSVYGTTTEGGSSNWGTIYSVNLMTKVEKILYDFRGGAAGGTPVGGMVYDGKGDLIGTASQGGSADGTAGSGVVFGYSLTKMAYKVLHTFTGPDGSQPMAALTPDGKGNYYGTTYAGGAHGYGTVFELNSTGTLTTLYSFTNGTDGAYPYGGVTLDSSGNVYGAATGGGQHGWGTLFEIIP
ncbi:MAG: choice-of-anchor tandem repeat GloVer-containing protein [Bryobacteraceae bacterium]